MMLLIPPDQVVFRWAYVNKAGSGPWHILSATVPTGYDEKTSPKYPALWGTNTHRALCGFHEDDVASFDLAGKFPKDRRVEFSTVGQVDSICIGCHPYQKIKRKPLGCPDCGSPYPDGPHEAHFIGCPREKKGKA